MSEGLGISSSGNFALIDVLRVAIDEALSVLACLALLYVFITNVGYYSIH